MKRIITLFIILTILLTTFAACSSTDSDSSEIGHNNIFDEINNTKPESEPEPEEEKETKEEKETELDSFKATLISQDKNIVIPDELNYYNKLIGAWDIQWVQSDGKTANGDWYFSWIIEGMAVQDVYILPSLDQRENNTLGFTDYGSTIRKYDIQSKTWEGSWWNGSSIIWLDVEKEDNMIVHTKRNSPKEKWVFVEINDDDFHWQAVRVSDDGEWRVDADMYGTRKESEPGANFYEMLISQEKNARIPDEYDYYEKLIGSWELEYVSQNNDVVKGEWHFSRILEGTVMQDVFITPSRETRGNHPEGFGEYGSTIKTYHSGKKLWEVMYIFKDGLFRLESEKEDDLIIHTKLSDTDEKWIFVEITEDTFHWQNVRYGSDGTMHVNADIYAKRIA